ncbi:hypothetical protein B1J93_08860 [Leptospira kirschneri serovar Pomona]|uniref:Uncharacterized protein n=1 Tax=Leptospira kirschneri serovar Pomona TaxID=561005 RepID=A0A1T1DQC4_9LEPT|nr:MULTISPECIES: hypothetical protein [Leptospira]OOV43075.1 hypothetical protein B1J93_08860 [Leptospira kirschneri serovar Pomona]
MFHKTVQNGVLYVLGYYGFEKYILSRFTAIDESGEQPISDVHLLLYSEEFLEFLEIHNLPVDPKTKSVLEHFGYDFRELFQLVRIKI